MCMERVVSREIAALIETDVERRVQAGEAFTALDVSRAVQARGVRKRHREMKHVVHALFAAGRMGPDYARTLADVGGALGPAWVYHPSWQVAAATESDVELAAERN